jgi:phage tail-like protein
VTTLERERHGGPASRRAYLRGSLPEIYREPEDALSMRFVTGLEEVLDPIVSLLDSLPAHINVELAPRDLRTLVVGWLGIDVRETVPADPDRADDTQRALAREAMSLVRRRGTRAGLERLLQLAFPALHVTVEETGHATWSAKARPAPVAMAPGFTVRIDGPALSRETDVMLRRVVRRNVPAHVPGTLEIGSEGEVQPL